MIKSILQKYNLKNKISYLCELAGVSRSGYYNYFSEKSILKRNRKESKEIKLYELDLCQYLGHKNSNLLKLHSKP